MPTMHVTPVSASGWVIAGEARVRAPEPFTVALQSSEPGRWFDLVFNSAHEFAGRKVELKQRHDKWTGEVEIIVLPAHPGDQISAGPGVIREAPRVSQY